jgi:hypothetical protein
VGVEEGAVKLAVNVNFVDLETQVLLALTKLRRNDPYYVMEITWGLSTVTMWRIVN